MTGKKSIVNHFLQACILLSSTAVLASYLPVSHTNAHIGKVPTVGYPGFGPAPGLLHSPFPRYHYHYKVNDPTTGDFKHHAEQREGSNVVGEYSLREADGRIRHVKYVADINGFRSKVYHTPGNNVGGHRPVSSY